MERAHQARPDLILIDLQLPDMTGDAVLDALRRQPLTRAIPIVVLSADATLQSRTRLVGKGADDYISKPFGVEDLLRRLDRILLEAAEGR